MAVFLGRALGLFSRCGEEAVSLATETAERMCEGQMRELRALYDLGRTPEEYLDAVVGKTASMFRLAALLGGILGGARSATRNALAGYGEALGIAHQIIDDVLDLSAGAERTGKPQGNDLRNGNYTLPVIYALEERPELCELIQADASLEVVMQSLARSRAISRAIDDARRRLAGARAKVGLLSSANGLARDRR